MSGSLTQRIIKNSFMKLLNERPMDKISINDIAAESGVNRNTFYYHFQDVYDLVDKILEEEAAKVLRTHDLSSQWQEAIMQGARFIMENKRAISHIYHSVNREQLQMYVMRVSQGLIRDFVEKQAEGLCVSKEDIELITMVYQHAVAGMLLEWVRTGMKDDPEYLIPKLTELFHGNTRKLLENASKSAFKSE